MVSFNLPAALLESGRFSLRSCLGSGGFGIVYAAYDKERGADVALKWLRHGDPSMLTRFKREFRSLADLDHPNLVHFRDLFSMADDWFFTMDLVDGGHLLDHLRPIPVESARPTGLLTGESSTLAKAPSTIALPIPAGRPNPGGAGPATRVPDSIRPLCVTDLSRLRSSLDQLAAGLMVIHAAGMLHRDVKPSNVMVTRDGRVVLLDFGLVTEIGEDGNANTAEERIVGTPAYMSPEQGLGSTVTAASDWYAVGVILYESLTGELPIAGSGQDVLTRKNLVDPIPPQELVRGIPPQLCDLCMDLLRRDPATRPSGEAFVARLRAALPFGVIAVGPEVVPSHPAEPSVEFVGREPHLWALDEAVQELERGQAVVALVHGASGMGKSALVRHFVDGLKTTRPDVLVLEGRCYEREAVPYKAVDSLVDALARHLLRLPEVESAALLPRDLPLLARVFPVFLQLKAAFTKRTRPPADVVEGRRRAFLALRELLHRLSEKSPVVLFVDDLQWADADSEPLLYTLLRGPDAPALLFLAAFRSDDADGSPVVGALKRLGASEGGPLVCDVPVTELPAPAVRALAISLLGKNNDAGVVDALVREAGGSPLFLRQLAALGARSSVVGLAEAVRARMTALPGDARRLLEVLALVGKPIDLNTAAQAAEVDDVDAALRKLQVENLARSRVRQGRSEVETYHDRIREVVAASLKDAALTACHASIARALSQEKDRDAEALAIHYFGASENELACRYAQEAAERASRTLAFDRAARMFEMALDLESQRGEQANQLVIRLAEALASAGRGKESAERFLQAAGAAKGASALDLTRRAAEQLLLTGHLTRGRAVVEQILRAMNVYAPKTAFGALMSLLLRRAYLRIRGFGFRVRSIDTISRDQLVRIDLFFSLARGLGVVDPWRGMDFQTRYLLASLSVGEPVRVAMGIALEAAYRSSDGFSARGVIGRLLAQAEKFANEAEHPHARAMTTLMRGAASSILGDFREGISACDAAAEQLRETCVGVAWELNTATIFGVYSRMGLGRLNEIRGSMPAALGDAQARGDLYCEVLLRTAASWFLKLAADDVAGARAELEFIMDRWSRDRWLVQHGWRVINVTEVALYEGSPEIAYDGITAAWPQFKRQLMLRTESVRVRSFNCRARAAMALAVASEGQARRTLLAEAKRWANQVHQEKWPLSKAFALTLKGALALEAGHAVECGKLLEQAEQEFEQRGAQLYGWSCRARRGQVQGGDAGAALLADACGKMTSEGVARPLQMLRVFTPGPYDEFLARSERSERSERDAQLT